MSFVSDSVPRASLSELFFAYRTDRHTVGLVERVTRAAQDFFSQMRRVPIHPFLLSGFERTVLVDPLSNKTIVVMDEAGDCIIGEGGEHKVYHGFVAGEHTSYAVALRKIENESDLAKERLEHAIATHLRQTKGVVPLQFSIEILNGRNQVFQAISVYPYFSEGDFYWVLKMGLWQRCSRLERLEMMAQLAEALDLVHQQNVLHNDVKIENAFLRKTRAGWECALGDFGCSQFIDRLESRTKWSGSLHTFPPEKIWGHMPSFGSDAWSLGLLYYQLLGEGGVPWQEWNLETIRGLMANDSFIPRFLAYLDGKKEFYGEDIIEALKRFFAYRPEERILPRDFAKLLRAKIEAQSIERQVG